MVRSLRLRIIQLLEQSFDAVYRIPTGTRMKIGDKLLKELNKKYPPSTLVRLRFERYDVALKTDEEGMPILLFIGEADGQGQIRGERFSRRLVRDASGKIVKDHWDNQGKV